MNIDEILKEIIVRIATVCVDKEKINENTVLTNDLGYDSVQVITLIVEVESEFKIEIEDGDLEIENLVEYRRLRDMIMKKVMNRTL